MRGVASKRICWHSARGLPTLWGAGPSPNSPEAAMKNVLRIGVLLIVAWIVLKIVFNVVGFLFHLLLIGGIIFVIWYVVTNMLGRGRPRQY
jgi:hypothetical protein